MPEPKQLACDFLAALASGDAARLAELLAEDAGMRVWGWDGGQAYRPRDRVMRALIDQWSAWPDPSLETISLLVDGNRVAVEFRIQATEAGRYVEHNRAAFLTLGESDVQMIDLYCSEPQPSARRKGWIAPVSMSDEEINRLFASALYIYDPREWLPPLANRLSSLRLLHGGSDDPHPGSNEVASARWTAEEADVRIKQIIEDHRRREVGFSWFVGPYDAPPDLGERLERHGLVLAGDQAMMARVGLDDLDIPTNSRISIEALDGSDDDAIEAVVQIVGRCFNWTPQQVDDRRVFFFQRLKNPEFREREIQYLARLDGVPVADALVSFRGGIAYLNGASTLPEYRNQKIYSTLLRRRLEDARARGYHVAAINAEPMSRRVVSRYGFKEYARYHIYVWMPVIDMDVVRALVPNE